MKENKIVQIYKLGKMVEEYQVYDVYSRPEGEFREGIKNGFYKRYEFDELVEEGNYKDGEKHGLWRKYHTSFSYYENGKEKKRINNNIDIVGVKVWGVIKDIQNDNEIWECTNFKFSNGNLVFRRTRRLITEPFWYSNPYCESVEYIYSNKDSLNSKFRNENIIYDKEVSEEEINLIEKIIKYKEQLNSLLGNKDLNEIFQKKDDNLSSEIIDEIKKNKNNPKTD